MANGACQSLGRLTLPPSVMSSAPRMFRLFAVGPGPEDVCGRPIPGRPPRKLDPEEVEELGE